MQLIRKSLVHKTSFLAVMLVALGAIFYIVGKTLHLTSFTLSAGQLLFLLYFFFAILLWFFFTHVLVPLQKVTRQIKAVLSGQRYEKIELQGKVDELGLLAKFFNSVVESLERVSHDIIDRKRLTEELNFAGKVQKNLLPKKAPLTPGLDVVVKTRSATEVGGDNFDIIPLADSTLIYVGDATGHGFPAGLVMSMINVLIHTFASLSNNTRDILVNVNRFLVPKINATMFMTLVMLRWEHEAQRLFYTGCGHEHLLIYRAVTGKCEAMKTGGIALGMVPNIEKIISEKEIPLNANDAVVLFTDGITEAKNDKGEMFGVARLCRLVEESAHQNHAEGIFTSISKEFAKFAGKGFVQKDDITLLVLKYNFKNIDQNKKTKLNINTEGIRGLGKPNWEW